MNFVKKVKCCMLQFGLGGLCYIKKFKNAKMLNGVQYNVNFIMMVRII